MTTYQALADCIRSDQLSAEEVAAAMKDEIFARWYKKRYG